MICPNCGEIESADVMGHEIRGVYDGVLYWSHPVCGTAWARDWTGYGAYRQDAADRYVELHNQAVANARTTP